MDNKKQAIICDIDGTLSNSDHRKHYVEGENKNFKKFYLESFQDKVNLWCLEIIKKLANDYTIFYVTGRPAEYRDLTKKWLKSQGCPDGELYMREIADFRQDVEVKKEIYEKNIKNEYNILFTIDDRQQVVDMWRSLGLVCLQCDRGDF